MTTDTVGGVWAHSLELARGLSQLGVQTDLAVLGGYPTPAARAEAREIPGLLLHESEFRLPWMKDPWVEVARGGAWLLELCERIQPDVVHLSEPVFAALPWQVPTVVVGHSCMLSWWEAVHRKEAPREWGRYRQAMIEGLSCAGVLVAPTGAMLAQLRRHYGIGAGRVIPNGRDSMTFQPQKKEPLVFTAGRLWDEAKNVGTLDAAAASLDWPIYAAGDLTSPDGDTIRTPQHLHLLGRLETLEIAAWMGRSSIYALPARYEPFGLTVLEAALSGCALVLGDIPSLREQWAGAACFAASDDPHAFRWMIDTLIRDEGRRRSLVQTARARALLNSPVRMAAAYRSLYLELLANRTRQEVIAWAS
jgi:glycosyltransferase involved in cell wall biosynthesis